VHVPLHPVFLARAHEEVVDQIVYAIRSGILRPGDHLPTIETVAARTDVSKPVVGEAVRVLREAGIVETKRGVQGGVMVVGDSIPPSLMRVTSEWRGATLTELVEARRPIEMELALLAGERGTDEDFQAMQATLDSLGQAFEQGPEGTFLRYDHRFHYQIGLAARSEMLAYYQHRILCEIAAVLCEYRLYHEDPELVVATHRGMLTAVESRDPVAIRAAVDMHWKTSSGAFAGIDELANGGEA
jgi:DNA-binding FadR family transcriptional regulator